METFLSVCRPERLAEAQFEISRFYIHRVDTDCCHSRRVYEYT